MFLFLVPSCLRYEGDGEDRTGRCLKVSVAVDPMVDPLTKSAITAQDEQAKDCNIWIYDDSGIFFEGYYTGFDDIRVDGLVVGNKYKVRAVANVGRLTAPASAEAADAMTFDWALSSLNSSDGIPMTYGTTLTMTMSSALTVHLKRVAARYTIAVNQDNLKGKYTIASMRLCNTSSKVLAFADSKVGVSGITAVDGDYATEGDIASLNEGKEVECFIYENNQGEILAGNSDPWKKEFENYNTDKSDYASSCTYLDMIGEYKSDSVTVHDLRYRMYLGKNSTTNFDVSRNTAYRIDVNPTEAKMLEESLVSWKLTHGFIDIKGETIVEREYYAPEVILTYRDDVGADGSATSAPKVTYSQKLKATYDDGHVKDVVVVPSGTAAPAGSYSFTASTYYGGSLNSSTGVVSANNLGTSVTSRRSVADVTVTLTSNGKTGSGNARVYQEENKASNGNWHYEGESSTDSYRNPSVSISATPSTFTDAGGTSALSCSASYEQSTSRTWTGRWRYANYTSGASAKENDGGGSETGTWSSKSTTSGISISDNGASGFSRSGTTVTISKNNTGSPRSFVCYADFKDPAGHSATRASVTIKQVKIEYKLACTGNAITVYVGDDEEFFPTVTLYTITDGVSDKGTPVKDKNVTFSTGNSSVATVRCSYNSTNRMYDGWCEGKAVGTTKIYASYTYNGVSLNSKDNNDSGISVTVKPEPVITHKLTCTGESVSVGVGQSKEFKPTVTYYTYTDNVQTNEEDVTKSATFSTGSTAIATVSTSGSGSYKTYNVTGVGEGSTKIYATYSYGNISSEDGISVTVTASGGGGEVTTYSISAAPSSLTWDAEDTSVKTSVITCNGTWSVSNVSSGWSAVKNNNNVEIHPTAANTSATDDKTAKVIIQCNEDNSRKTEITVNQTKKKETVTMTGLTLTLAKSELMAGGSTTYTVKATYSDGSTADVTSSASVSSSSSFLSANSGNVSSSKGSGCLGQFSLTASYGGKTDSQNLKVVTDFKSLTLSFTLSNKYGSDTSDGSKIVTASVPRGNTGEVTFKASVMVSSYNSGGDIVLKVDNDVISNGVSKTWMMQDGDRGTLKVYYLGELVGTCDYLIEPY